MAVHLVRLVVAEWPDDSVSFVQSVTPAGLGIYPDRDLLVKPSRQVMSAHGGFIRVAANEAGGAKFTLTF